MKKIFAAILALTMCAGLAACGGGGTSSPATTTAAGAVTPAGDATGTKLSGDLVYWSMWQETEPQADILKNAIKDFEAANPDVKLTVEWQGRAVNTLVGPALASAQQVDIFDSDPIGFYKSMVDPMQMMDLTDFYASESIDKAGSVEETMIKGLVDWDKALSAKYAKGGMHSIPYAPFTISWFYNKEMFTTAGIDKAPGTWEELDAACAKLKAAGFEPIVTDDAYFTMLFSYYLEKQISTEAIFTMFDKGGAAYNDPAILKTLQSIEDFAKKGYFAKSTKTNKYPAGQQQFARKEAAMYLNASFMASENAETAGTDFPYGAFPFTTVPGGVGKTTENTVGGQAFAVDANTKNKEAAYELLRYFVGNKCQSEFLAKGLVPCLTSIDWPKDLADQKPIVSALTKNIDWAAGVGGDFFGTIIQPELTKVTLGETTAQAAFDKIVKEAATFQAPAK